MWLLALPEMIYETESDVSSKDPRSLTFDEKGLHWKRPILFISFQVVERFYVFVCF